MSSVPVSVIQDEINGWSASLHDPHRFNYFKKGTWKPHKEKVLFVIDVLERLKGKAISSNEKPSERLTGTKR